LADGQGIVVTVHGAREETVRQALGAFSFAWETA
jgi:hypothetical protein